MKRQFLFIGFLITTLAVSSCQNAGEKEEQGARIPVEVTTVELGEVRQSLAYNGDINAGLDVKVFSKVPDRIETYFVDEGDFVRKGAPIAKIAATTIEQSVRQAEAGLAAAQAQEANLKSEFDRAGRLYKEDAMSQQQYDAVKTQYEAVVAQATQAQAALTSARSLLNDATITSPISGIIGKRYFEAGDMASPSMPVASVVQMDQVKIKAEATEQDLGRLAVGQEASVEVKSYPGETFLGRVTKISPILDPVTRMATVEVLIPNADHRLKPGMYAEVVITTGFIRNTLVVPRHAVIESTSLKRIEGEDQVVKNYYVFVANDSLKAEQRLLDVRYVNHKSLAVEGGIEVGERLVIAGQKNLRDGLSVTIPEKEAE